MTTFDDESDDGGLRDTPLCLAPVILTFITQSVWEEKKKGKSSAISRTEAS